MRLLTPPRTSPPAAARPALPTLPPLPTGYAPRITAPARPAAPHTSEAPPAAPRPVLVSGVLTTVTGTAGQPVHLHRADYQRPSVHGGWTIHGYAWRCPTCPAISRGFEPREFARALTDARTHTCTEGSLR
ncbi:hypothetical protein RM572_21870 [Streptomyces sp. DSM 42041]|uniref:Uncharacterized protein n=1 Tax=Streptomyces hazeniae TaxID=3075538 RepID=A0ABU2NWQ2_9ACTN|nr:hypothetical protein [Streptomyces sp. DSM 42041]MDT0381410.1 hypothetical protein [Streptomyces sp. DSM 42041]